MGAIHGRGYDDRIGLGEACFSGARGRCRGSDGSAQAASACAGSGVLQPTAALTPHHDRPYPLAGEQTGRCVTAALAVLRSTHETRVLRRLQTGCGRWRQSGRRDRRGEGHSAAWASRRHARCDRTVRRPQGQAPGTGRERARAAGPARRGPRPPLLKPENIICMAVNYMEDGTLPEPAPMNAFMKSPSAIIGDGDTMILPDMAATIFEGEAELAVVIGKRASHVKAADAMS